MAAWAPEPTASGVACDLNNEGQPVPDPLEASGIVQQHWSQVFGRKSIRTRSALQSCGHAVFIGVASQPASASVMSHMAPDPSPTPPFFATRWGAETPIFAMCARLHFLS